MESKEFKSKIPEKLREKFFDIILSLKESIHSAVMLCDKTKADDKLLCYNRVIELSLKFCVDINWFFRNENGDMRCARYEISILHNDIVDTLLKLVEERQVVIGMKSFRNNLKFLNTMVGLYVILDKKC